MSAMTIADIMRSLPHRFPMLLVDRVVECDTEARRIVAIKNVTVNEPFFQGHFPDVPIMPGVLQLESMAQVGGILLIAIKGTSDYIPYFMSIDRAKFRRPVVPGDQMRIEVEITNLRTKLAKFAAKILVEDAVASQAELMCMITPKEGA